MSSAGEIDLSSEWRRSDPDIVVYLPGGDNDGVSRMGELEKG